MKAIVLTGVEKLEMLDLPVPELDEGEALIRVKYAGICGSDLHIYRGHHPTAKIPVVLGHEFVGVVEQIRTSKPLKVKVGDRVAVEPLVSCGECDACLSGNEHVCRNLKLLGVHINGGFAEYIKASLNKLVIISSRVPDRVAALSEPFAVGVHVNSRSGLKPGDTALVIGGGPIGLVTALIARIHGASQVIISEVNPQRVRRIEQAGFAAINPAAGNGSELIQKHVGLKGFDVVFEVSGSQPGILFSTQACKIRGTIVAVGLPGKRPEFDIQQAIFKELTLVGSRVYTMEHFTQAVGMIEDIVAKKTFDLEGIISETYPFWELNKGLGLMKEGKNLGKILLENS